MDGFSSLSIQFDHKEQHLKIYVCEQWKRASERTEKGKGNKNDLHDSIKYLTEKVQFGMHQHHL